MSWWLRCVLWASAFALPGWWLSAPYQRLLAQLAERVLALGGVEIEIDDLDLFAPFDLVIFAALCLATYRAPWSERRRALWIGGAVLVVVEIGMIVLGVSLVLGASASGSPAGDSALVSHVLATVSWVAAGVVWIPLLGHYQLPKGLLERATPPRARR